jgi:AraC family transcriptional regulator, activator of mtrCDE
MDRDLQGLERLLCLLEVRLHAIGLCEVAPGWRLGLPCPEGVLVHFILAGDGRLRPDGGSEVPFRPGSLIFLHPQCGAHELIEGEGSAGTASWESAAFPLGEGMISFRAGDERAAMVSACGIISADCGGIDLFERLREPVTEDISGERAVVAAFELMAREFRSPLFGTRAIAEALMKQCLILALRAQMKRGEINLLSLGGSGDPRLMKALLEMLENPARDHSLDELARISGMSRSLFAERFSEAFHRPPMDLLKQVRLHRAANLLRTTQLPIQIVALTVGYASRSYFSRAFRAAYGTDPKSFREQARQGGQQPSSDKETQDA